VQVTPNEVTDDKGGEGKPWPTSDEDVIQWVAQRQKDAEQGLGEWYEQAKTDFAFSETRQWSEDDVAKLEHEKRVAVTFNLVHRTVNSICGQEVANRQEVKFLPRRLGDVQDASDPMSSAVKWFRDNCNAEDEDSDAFRDMVICGMGWTCTRMDYEAKEEGEPVVERRDPLLMRWDLAARRKNLADKKWVQSDYWMTKEAIQDRWPDADISALTNIDAPNNADPIDATENWKYKNDASGYEKFKDQWRVVHHVERFTVPVHRVIDPVSQKIMSLTPEQFSDLKEKAAQIPGMPVPTSVPGRKRVYWESWSVGKTALNYGVAKIQNGFQYECMTCVRERETGYWFGVVRLQIDPQKYTNRMGSLLMSILATGAKGGALYETGTFANPKKAKQDWARHDGMVEVNPGRLNSVVPKPQAQMPPGSVDMMQLAMSMIQDVPGINIEMLGQQKNDQPGIVEDMRTKAGLIILASVFDAKRLYVKRQGLILAEFVTKFLSDGRLIRIWGPQGQQFIPLVRNPEVTEYDIVVDESPASRDVKERTWIVLKEIMPGMMQMGVPIPPSVVDYLPIPESLANDFKRSMAMKASQPPQPPPEVLKAQAQANSAIQVAQTKAAVQAHAEQARMAADVQIEHDKAQVQLQLNAMKQAQDAHFQQQQAVLQQHTTILTAIINQIGKVAAAEVTASKDTDSDARNFTSASAYPQ